MNRRRKRKIKRFFRRYSRLMVFCLIVLILSVGIVFGVKSIVRHFSGKSDSAGETKEATTNIIKEMTDDNGKTYLVYLDDQGEPVKNTWKTTSEGKTYYLNGKGRAVKGFKKIEGKLYHFKKNCTLTNPPKGKKSISHYLCFFNKKGQIIRRIDKDKPMVALTYDDGPSANTETILDVLENHNAVATFFVVGERIDSYQDTVKREVALGNEIGNHTWSHTYLTQAGGKKGIRSQINKTIKKVKKLTGYKSTITRPPGGFVDDQVKKYVGQPLILWNVDTMDWSTRNAKKTIDKVFSDLDDGDIILMHDLYETTAEATKTIVPRLIKKGFQLVTVSEMAECHHGMSAGDVVYSLKP